MWNSSGTFATRWTAGPLTAHREYILPDFDMAIPARVSSVAALKASGAPNGPTFVFVEGYYSAGGAGGGPFYWDSASVLSDNGGTVLIPNSAPASGRWRRPIDGDWLNIKWFGARVDDSTDDTTAVSACVAAIGASGGTIFFPAGATRVSQLNLTGKQFICLEGVAGRIQSSIRWTSTTNNVVEMGSARFITVRQLNFLPAAQKTAGVLFNMPSTTSDIYFEHLRVSSALIGWECDATNVFFKHIDCLDLSATFAWTSMLRVGPAAQAASIHIDDMTIQSQTTFGDAAVVVFNVDTMICRDMNAQKQGAGLFSGIRIAGGEFIQLHNCHFEGGTSAAIGIDVQSGANINIVDCHAASNLIGFRITGGLGVEFIGGRSYFNARNGVALLGGQHVLIDGVNLPDNSTSTAGAWDAINISAGVSDFRIVNCTNGSVRGVPNNVRYGVNLFDGASNRYVIANNNFSDYNTAAVYDGGTGNQKTVKGNTNATEDKPQAHAVVTTTDGAAVNLWTLGLIDESTYYVHAVVMGQDSTTTRRFAYQRTCLAYRDSGGAATIQGQSALDTIESDAGFDATFDTSVNSLRLRVTGSAGVTLRWRGTISVFRSITTL